MKLPDVLERLGLPADAAIEPAAGGASGSAWKVGAGSRTYAVRLAGPGAVSEGRIVAMRTARAAGLPAPDVLRRAELDGGIAVLLEWLPGITLMDAVIRQLDDAPHWARKMGALQRRLHAVTAPREVVAALADRSRPFAAGRDAAGLPSGDMLLHLDWHPLNLLVDTDSGEITGIVDWDNARRGHPMLDLARTRSILTLDPSVAALPSDVRAAIPVIIEGWADGYGSPAREIPGACLRWAALVMLADLEPRYAASPQLLDPIRVAVGRQAKARRADQGPPEATTTARQPPPPPR